VLFFTSIVSEKNQIKSKAKNKKNKNKYINECEREKYVS
jgi:hypothetical protein